MESEPNEREWKCRYEREKAVANNIANSFSRVVELSTDAKGILADLAYLEITDYRAELTAPAGGDDREAAEKLYDDIGIFADETKAGRDYRIGQIEAALHAARQAERAEGEAIKTAELEFVRTTGLLVADYATMGKATPERQEQYILARDALAALVGCEKEVESGE